MDRSDVIYLLTPTTYEDQMHVIHTEYEERKIFASVDSVTGREWHDGGRNGLNPEFRMTVFAYDYRGEQVLRYDSPLFGEPRYYTIYRTYQRTKDDLELYVERRKGNANPDTGV